VFLSIDFFLVQLIFFDIFIDGVNSNFPFHEAKIIRLGLFEEWARTLESTLIGFLKRGGTQIFHLYIFIAILLRWSLLIIDSV